MGGPGSGNTKAHVKIKIDIEKAIRITKDATIRQVRPKSEETIRKLNGKGAAKVPSWHPLRGIDYTTSIYDWTHNREKSMRIFLSKLKKHGYGPGRYMVFIPKTYFYPCFKDVVTEEMLREV